MCLKKQEIYEMVDEEITMEGRKSFLINPSREMSFVSMVTRLSTRTG